MSLSTTLMSFLSSPEVSVELRIMFERLSDDYDIDIKLIKDTLSMQDMIVIMFKNHGTIVKEAKFRTSGLSKLEIIQAMEMALRNTIVKEEVKKDVFIEAMLSKPTLTASIDPHSNIVNSRVTFGPCPYIPPSSERSTVSSDLAVAIAKELKYRGDFALDIPKFVDLLFKMGVVIAKEDVETKESEEQVTNTNEENPW